MKFLKYVVPLYIILLTGCSSAPVQEMSDARQALDAARLVEADRHAPKLMLRAKTSLLNAEKALEQGEWKKARKSAIEARIEAIAARSQADSGYSEN
jgi:hypothetical protein